ncbi:MAG: lycopene cyclase domain-containing protein [Haloferacaceae archaeon]
MTLSYLGFHAVFVLPPLLVLILLRPPLLRPSGRAERTALAILVAAAVLYTTPWDSYMIDRGVWYYGDGTVLARVAAVPLGEYLFFILQTVVTGLWLSWYDVDPSFEPGDWRATPRVAGALVALGAAAAGVALLTTANGFYLGAILAWACPLFALQWAVGGGYLVRAWTDWLPAALVPTLYFAAADRVAIGLGIWTIAPETSTGLLVLGLPIEEGAFFLVVTLLVVWGMTLYAWLCSAHRAGAVSGPLVDAATSVAGVVRWR